jgi:hypothetical protein
MEEEFTTIRISKETKRKLDYFKYGTESYDLVVNRLIGIHKLAKE